MPASGFDALGTLEPVRRTLGISRLLRWTVRGALAGSAAAVLLLIAGHLHPLALTVPAALFLLALGLAAGVAAGIRSWPEPAEAARLVDRHFSLADRLTTALELRASSSPVAQLQRSSAAAALDGLPLRRSARSYPRRMELTLCALSLVAVAALSLAGLPAATSAAPADRQGQHLIQNAARKVPVLRKHARTGLTAEERKSLTLRKLDAALAKLQRQLRHASSRAAALRSISLTQQQLHRIAAGLHPLNSHAVAQLNRSLHGYMGAKQRQEASKPSSALKATAGTLKRLAAQMAHMTSAQKAALARALAKGAATAGDSSMRSKLQAAASSLAYNDPQSAAQSLRQAAALAAAGPSAAAAGKKLRGASSSLDSLKSSVAGLPGKIASGQSAPGGTKSGSGGDAGKGTGKGSGEGQGKGTGNGSGGGQGKGNGKGSGSGRGQGKGSGNGKGSGSGHGSGSGQGGSGQRGQGGSGGHGLGGGHGSNGPTGRGHYATVFVSGNERSGPKTSGAGPNGAPAPGSIVPYRQVVESYTSQARTALGSSALTPSQRQAVQRYFTRISR